jgi:hypothetical protein
LLPALMAGFGGRWFSAVQTMKPKPEQVSV